ncbi:MAG: hypothetical protein M3413_04745 [Bacteroidota bacterium]|nr:hypothetical protein [Bacteroidota bacterium]
MNKKYFLFLITILLYNNVLTQDTREVRNRRWQEDLLYFKDRFPAYDKTITPFIFSNAADSNKLYSYSQKNSIEVFLKGVDSLYKAVDQLSDDQLMIGICKLVALSPNAHTRLLLFRLETVMNNLPIGIYWFGNDLHITAAPPAYKAFLGAKINAINGIPIDSVKKRVDELNSGNSSWKRYMSLYYLRSPQALKGLSLVNDAKQLSLTVTPLKGKEQILSMKADFVPQTSTVDIWKDLSPNWVKKDSLMHVLLENKRLPLYLQNPEKNYWYQYLEKAGIVYLNFSRTDNTKDLSFYEFALKLINDIKDKPYSKFVIDVRFNTGGDNDIAEKGLIELAANLKNKQVYIITGYPTFSAGVTTSALFKWYTGAKVIGELAGDGLVYFSEGGDIQLPHSKLYVHYANGFHNDIFIKGFNIRPDKEILVSFQDYLNGEDPILNFVIMQNVPGLK